MKNIIINSTSSGKYHFEKKGGRDFLVTMMLPIQADSVMNGLLYPTPMVAQSYPQLNSLPAPAGHPFFNGEPVEAKDPEGASSFNVGAFVRNPTLNGVNVTAELVIDVEVANRCKEGQEIVQRVKNGEPMGVSTGLKASIVKKTGKKNGVKYTGVVTQAVFDHVAILLSQAPAGENTYTLNSSEFFNQQKRRKKIMREVTIDTSNLSLDDHKYLESLSGDAVAIVNSLKHEITEQEATQVLTNAGKNIVNQHEYDDFIANRDALKAFNEERNAERTEQINFVVANSKMSAENVSELSDEALKSMVDSIVPANKHIVNGKIETPTFEVLEEA